MSTDLGCWTLCRRPTIMYLDVTFSVCLKERKASAMIRDETSADGCCSA